MRSLLVALLLAQAGAVPALAQVAAPRLTPLFMGINEVSSIFNPALDVVNPAARMWDAGSIVGAGASPSGHYEIRDSNLGTVVQHGNAESQVAQLRLMSEFVAFNAELGRTRYSLRNGPVGSANIDFDVVDTRVELALKYADWLALGVARQASREHVKVTPVPTPPPDEDMRRTELQIPGVSLRFGVLHLGYAAGSQEVRIEGAAVPPPNTGATDSDRRRVTRSGVAVHDRGDTWGYHLELYREEREGFKLPFVFPGLLADKTRLSGITAEVIFHDVLVGFEKSNTDNSQFSPGPPPGPVDFKSDAARVSVGWVPNRGFTLLVTGQRAHRLAPAIVGELATLLVSLGWAF